MAEQLLPDFPANIDDWSENDFLLRLQVRVAERFSVSPVDGNYGFYPASFAADEMLTPALFGVLIDSDATLPQISTACDMLWCQIKDSFVEGSFVFWRRRPVVAREKLFELNKTQTLVSLRIGGKESTQALVEHNKKSMQELFEQLKLEK